MARARCLTNAPHPRRPLPATGRGMPFAGRANEGRGRQGELAEDCRTVAANGRGRGQRMRRTEEAMTLEGRVRWFNLDKKFGFVALANEAGDAFIHLSVLKAAGFVTLPAGATLRMRVETVDGKPRVVEIDDVT